MNLSKVVSIIVASCLSQLAGFFSVNLLNQAIASSTGLLLVHLLLVFLICKLFKIERRWFLYNLLFPIALYLGSLNIDYSIMFIFAFILLLLFLPTIWTRIPYYPTHKTTYQSIALELEKNRDFTFLDAGCGDGQFLKFLAVNFPNSKFVGVELSPLSYIVAKFTALFHNNLTIHYQSFWKLNFSDYDYVYAFLAPPPMTAFWDKARNEMKTNQTLLINSFPLPIKADKTLLLDPNSPDRSGTLYIYNIK